MATNTKQHSKYPFLQRYSQPLALPKRTIIGRDREINDVIAALHSPEISNVLLLGEPGVGKTEIVRAVAQQCAAQYLVVNVDLSALAATDNTDSGNAMMGYRLKKLVDDAMRFGDDHKEGRELVLFMDEFHLVAQVSTAALQALKPILAESGARHVLLIGATTYAEYDKYLRDDQALDERSQKIKVAALSDDVTMDILVNYMHKYLPRVAVDKLLLQQIIDQTNLYMPAEVQPRKSIRVLDSMAGCYLGLHTEFNDALLRKVLKTRYGIETTWQANLETLRKYLQAHVFGQEVAVNFLVKRLTMSIAGINDETRPLGSFLFTGSTGVGKTELAKRLAIGLYGSLDSHFIRFDMSEYSANAAHGVADAFREQLTHAVYEMPTGVLLLDEIEKADRSVIRLLLQVLDDARLRDQHEREMSFKNVYIIMTTNAGADIYEDILQTSGDNAASVNERIDSYETLIKKSLSNDNNNNAFPAELLGRIDDIIPFRPLEKDVRHKIVDLRLKEIARVVKRKYGVTLTYPDYDRVITYIADEKVLVTTKAGGGRDLKRRLDNDVLAKLAAALLANPRASLLEIKVTGTMALEDKHDRLGNAQIEVSVPQARNTYNF